MLSLLLIAAVYAGWRASRRLGQELRALPRNEDMVFY